MIISLQFVNIFILYSGKLAKLAYVRCEHWTYFYSLTELYNESFLRLTIGFCMLVFQPPVNFCSDENIQTIFETKLEDFLNYRIDYNSISQTVEKVVKKIFLARRKRPEVEIVRC
jgi:hypothetical protein